MRRNYTMRQNKTRYDLIKVLMTEFVVFAAYINI